MGKTRGIKLSKEAKERKIFEIIGISFLTFVITIIGFIFLLDSYMTSEIGEIAGRRSRGRENYNIGQEPGKFWGSFLLWAGLLLAIVGGLVYEIIKKIRNLKD